MPWNGFGEVDIDVWEDGRVIVQIVEQANGGLTPRMETEFEATRERLEAMRDGARWALDQLDKLASSDTEGDR